MFASKLRSFSALSQLVQQSAWRLSPRAISRTVLLGTLASTVAALVYVSRFASDLPNTDEWDFADVLTGPWPGAAWFFEHHNEHRYPLARLLWLTTTRLCGDFRAPMVLFVLMLAAASSFLISAAQRVRGAASLGDLFIPAMLLHWGHGFNYLMGYQVAFGLFALGLAGVAWAIVAARPHLAGILACLAVQSGGFGLAAAPALVLLFIWIGWRGHRTVLLWALIFTAYAAGVAMTMPPASPVAQGGPIRGTVLYLAIAPGPVILQLGPLGSLLVGGVIMLFGLSACGALVFWDRTRAVGYLVLLGAFALSAFAVGYGRGEWSVAYRFVTTSAIGLALAWVPLAPRLGWIGLPLALAIYGVNVKHAVWYGKLCKTQMTQFEADLHGTGYSPVFLAGKHGNAFHILRGAGLPVIAKLRDAGWPRYADVPDDPRFTLVPARCSLPAVLVCRVEEFEPGGSIPQIPVDALPQAVVGLRIHGMQQCCMVRQKLRLRWNDLEGRPCSAEVNPMVMPGEFVVTFPMHGVVSNVRVEPATWSAGLRLDSAEWLVAK